MEDGDLSSLIIVLLLIVVTAFVTLIYNALTNVRQSQMREQAESGHGGAQRVLTIMDSLSRLNVTYQLSLLILHVVIVALATLTLMPALVVRYPAVAPAVIQAATLIVIVLAVALVGNLVPATLGTAYADRLAPALSGVAHLVMILFSPLVAVLLAVSKLLAGLIGGDNLSVTVTEEEIMTLVDAGQKEGTIEIEEKAMIFSILQFGETLVREVMIPRMDIEALEINTSVEVALGKFLESGHSRIPIYDEKIDNIEGLLYAKDLLSLWHSGDLKSCSIRDLMRPAYFMPEDKRADLVLKEMQDSKIHLAIVVDEYGGTAGIVTIENLIEEIVGDIQDEYDVNEEDEYIRQGEHEYVIDASMDLDDINELLKADLPTEESDTLGGFIYGQLGRVPKVGEVIEDPEHNLILRVDSIDGRRIRKVHITRINTEPGMSEEASEMSESSLNDKQVG